MQNRRNYYRVLQVQPDAAREVIKASYRVLMQKLKIHPDLGGDERDASLINEAYAVLSDEKRRAQYDLEGGARDFVTGSDARSARSRPVSRGVRRPPHAGYPVSRDVTCPFCGRLNTVVETPQVAWNCANCRSPLQPVDRAGPRSGRRRAIPRLPHRASVRLFMSWPAAQPEWGRVLDLSPWGLRLQCAVGLSAGAVVKIDSELFSAVGRIADCQPASGRHEHAVGVEFITLEFRRAHGSFVTTRV